VNNKTLFKGFKSVFNFTAKQSVKAPGFKVSSIIISLIIGALFAAISIVMAFVQLDDKSNELSKEDIENGIINENTIDKIYYSNETKEASTIISDFSKIDVSGKIKFTEIQKSSDKITKKEIDSLFKKDEDAVLMVLKENKIGEISIKYYLLEDGLYTEDELSTFAEYFSSYLTYQKLTTNKELTDDSIVLYNAPVNSQAVKWGDDAKDEGVSVAQILVPMVFSLLLYTMILLYGQNITKVVVSEKSSKLMETLLTSVKPYAIISGKVFAISAVALFQMATFIASAIIGFIVGDIIALEINPDYINYVKDVLNVIGDSSDAFSPMIIILSVLSLVIGFLLFSVLAGLVAATVDKMEDISTAMALFQIPVIIGFLGSYFSSIFQNDLLTTVIRYVPVTSPFILPADLFVGNMNVVEGINSLIIMLITLNVLILFTGKVYKGKIFNQK